MRLSAGPDLPRLRLLLQGQSRAFTIEGQRLREVLYRIEESRGYDSNGELWAPGYFRVDLSLDASATLTVSTEPWETIQALTPDQAFEAEHERRDRLLELAGAERDGKGARRARAGRRSVCHSANGPGRGYRPCPCRRRRGAQRDRGLSLVHGLGTRHDDQPRGPGIDNGPSPGSRLHSCGHLPVISATGSFRIFSPTARTTASTTPPMRRSGTSTLWTVISRPRKIAPR